VKCGRLVAAAAADLSFLIAETYCDDVIIVQEYVTFAAAIPSKKEAEIKEQGVKKSNNSNNK